MRTAGGSERAVDHELTAGFTKLSTLDGSGAWSSRFCSRWAPAARQPVTSPAPGFRSTRSVGGETSGVPDCARVGGPAWCVRTCVPTSTETPIERGSVTRRDGQGVDRGNGSGSRASPGGRPGASLPRVRGPLGQADRRSSRSLSGDGQGVLLRPDGEKARAVKARYVGSVPRLRRVHTASERQGRCLRVLQGLSPRRHRAALDARACARRDARVAGLLWPLAVLV